MTVYPKVIESKNDYLFAANLKYAKDETDEYVVKSEVAESIKCCFVYSDYDRLPLTNKSSEKLMHRSLRRGETYRYGVIFYDTKGRASSVYPIRKMVYANWNEPTEQYYWLTNGDITVPKLNPSEDISFEEINNVTKEVFNVRRVGLKVAIDEWPADCAGYQVVRCLRTTANKKVLCQGITGLAVEQTKIGKLSPDDDGDEYEFDSTNTEGRCCTPGPITMQRMLYACEGSEAMSMPNGDVLMFACPEYAYQEDDM